MPPLLPQPPQTSESPNIGASLPVNAVIAAAPAMFLTLVICFVGAYTVANRSLWAKGTPPSLSPSSPSAKGAPPSGAMHHANSMLQSSASTAGLHSKIDAMEFKNLCVTVSLGTKAAQQKREALMNKAQGLHRLHHNQSFMKRLFVRDPDAHAPRTTDDDLTCYDSENIREAAEFVVNLHGTGREWCIIKNCSGKISGGEVIGVVGPSGCGKTTLLGVLAGSAVDLGAGTTVTGRVTVDGEPRKSRQVAYVPQADHLIPTLTVLECVRYSALLRLPKGTKTEEIQHQVESTLDELGIRHVAESQVGGSGMIRGISGGERRTYFLCALCVYTEHTLFSWKLYIVQRRSTLTHSLTHRHIHS